VSTEDSFANENGTIDKGAEACLRQLIRPTRFIGDPEATEATLRPSAGLESQAIALETEHLSRTVVERVLVSDISVQVQPGEVLAVVGPSGAGKSSFLRLLNRLDEPIGGTVRLNGQDYRELAPRHLRRRVGMVMQVAYLFSGTVAANVAFGPRQCGERLRPEQIASLLDRVGLLRCQQRDVSNLSGGEAQRVSLARTLANAPEALLLDEPTSALDAVSARGIEDLVLSIVRERRMTCVIVTHNTVQAHRIADRTMVLEAGKLVTIGPTKEVLRDR
jgi:putative ABC transport system ATP-binding protein